MRVDQLLEAFEVDDGDMVDVDAREVAHGTDRERGASDLVGRVDPVRAVTGDVHPQVSRDREVVEAMVVGIGADEHHRVGMTQALLPLARPRVRSEKEDRRRLREQHTALV